MHARWRNFELPVRVTAEQETLSPTYGKFVAEPFERGFGTTVGNALRRVLLSSLEGAAVTSIKIKGISHEYSSIDGVVEDVTDIVLNIKRLRVRCDSKEPQTIRLKASGSGEVTAGQIETGSLVEVVNKDLHIVTIDGAKSSIEIEMDVRRGRGFKTAAELQAGDQEIGIVPIDAAFSPVERVRFLAENTRVGQMTNYDKLILEIWTKGTVAPDLALVEAAKILRKHLNPFVKIFDLGEELPAKEAASLGGEADLDEEEQGKRLALPISALGLSARSVNGLDAANIKTVAELVAQSEDNLMELRNLGRSSVREIQKRLTGMGLSLGMKLETVEA